MKVSHYTNWLKNDNYAQTYYEIINSVSNTTGLIGSLPTDTRFITKINSSVGSKANSEREALCL